MITPCTTKVELYDITESVLSQSLVRLGRLLAHSRTSIGQLDRRGCLVRLAVAVLVAYAVIGVTEQPRTSPCFTDASLIMDWEGRGPTPARGASPPTRLRRYSRDKRGGVVSPGHLRRAGETIAMLPRIAGDDDGMDEKRRLGCI